ncbi:MoaD/ThiS family protein [Acetobacter fallax]|uniref:Molybdopterin synthase sulfur carrier subunit n=1 Tax=Acetobacter fallax TaxID=1737473 RepID=A0ABX0KD78_9PROT|nr:MoaD/ThiS family protein [Acetobacter fallax]NHO33419.1 molybdopterin synthase sulfur carrier subunit [Acetobacter fallax]NHO37038.1 molybdopterin synthase sulfur carrier subunit [Acetobacter fallax]
MPGIEPEYFAQPGEQAGRRAETRETSVTTAVAFYEELRVAYGFALPAGQMRVAVNAAFCPWTRSLKEGDHVVFIPPVSGG